MKKLVSILFSLSLFCFCAFGQNEKYTTPVKWGKYKVSSKNVSVLLPKMPVLDELGNYCSEQETNQYASYAEGVVYGLNITSKFKHDNLRNCDKAKKFNEKSFGERVAEIKTLLEVDAERKYNQNDSEIVKIKNELFTYWLINDFANRRWFEFWSTDSDEKNETVKKFIESVKFEKNANGIEIGKGAIRTLGDETSPNSNAVGLNSNNAAVAGKDRTAMKRVIIKPRARYTDAARQTNVQGTVVLKVTFLANGGIGSIVPVSTLPNGLTEQAILAASRIVFIPAQKNGVNYITISPVQYNFSIY